MQDTASDPESMERCVEILTGGFVQSFVDFFYLTHQDKGEEEGTMVEERKARDNADDMDLKLISEKLTEAERARRSGNPSVVFENYEQLAIYFGSQGSPETSVHFFNKCLKLSQLVNDQDGERRAMFQIGMAHASIPGETEKAIEYLEKHLNLASQARDDAACESGRAELAKVYDRRAEELSTEDRNKSVFYLEKLLKIASENRDHTQKAQANFRLGKAFNGLKKPERAIVALTQTLEHAEQTGDIRLQGETCSALADAYLQVENKVDKAIEYLQKTRTIAKENVDDQVQSRACKMLASVYTKLRNHDQAVQFYEQNFELVRKQFKAQQVTPSEVDRSRVLLGISLKNARRLEWRKMVRAAHVPTLLAWKVQRDFTFHD